jgi:putative transposase
VFVSAADLDEREGAKTLLCHLDKRFPRLSKIWADSGYTGPFGEWVKKQFNIEVEIIKRTDDLKGFKIVPRRWVVERTFGWFGRFRRLSKDYELLPEHSESMIYLAMMQLMLRRLVR